MNIILSIKPKWAELIYSGKKTIEWRKSWPKYEQFEFYHVGKVFLYETAPVKMITGYFELNGCRELIIRDDLEKKYKDIHPDAKEVIAAGCVPLEDLKKYQGKNFSLFGWRIKNPTKFEEPLPLSYVDLKRPPQSWCYDRLNASTGLDPIPNI